MASLLLRTRLAAAANNRRGNDGFNLVELLISSVILLITLVGAVTISVTSSMNSFRTGQRYQQEAAIDADLALIQRYNDRYTCASGTCEILAGTGDMGRNDFFPDPVPSLSQPDSNHDGVADAAETALEAIQDRCRYRNNLDLVTPLKTLIEANLAAPIPSELQRTIAVDATTQGGAHRYTVTYTNLQTNEMMRQMTLSPATVAWCPRI
ncbi:prepilin-type N-terminal cleavage/methylation domain-containing protein [Synechococcus sp. CCY9201]|uniref:PulJ/GspJ family protein n=1 Tax=unclassified Synechococcus TaxID=2626047 RepID=UPI002B1FEFCC|nr:MULTISPECIES: prepilin-type N-terminal cleavage/methylation domain-containing protein [unclassified Synechococcus]MEA5421946.1 prepilin-type N-terminal cleavage/methylation domain-containing protein [Synechococcus sp. CCY9202]MEA5475552.1 prepilin-type N-terminal cleavage/methylation domain-containing protein [Synechococcus sp. CCY9201]